MSQDLEARMGSDVLMPSLPWDLGVRAQQQRIFDAMAKSSAEKSFAATTIADIVGYASISRATFYKHFTNKEECFKATADAFMEELRAVANEAHAEGEGSAPEVVRGVIAAVVGRLAAKPHHARMLLIEAAVIEPAIVARCRELVLDALSTHELTAMSEANDAAADPEAAFGSAVVLVAGQIAAGEAGKLTELLPELVYITMRPFAGQEVALAQARLSR